MKWVSVQEAAQMLGCSINSIYRMCKDGRLPASRPVHRLRIPLDSVQAILEKKLVKKP